MIRPAVVLNYLGKIIVIIGIAMFTSVIWSFYYREAIAARVIMASFITIAVGLLITYLWRHQKTLNYREGFAVVTMGWIAASLFGTLPFLLSGYFPNFADALFETVSGFTTTGATILSDVEALPKSLLFWRSLTQWLGGMGIMALFIAVIVGMGVRANQIFRAEVPGPVSDKISPRIRETAKILWQTYVVISLVLLVLLLVSGMNLFDSFCHTFSTMATGGFSTRNQSVGYYNPISQWIIIIFMFIAGANFSLHYLAFKGRSLRKYFNNKEFVAYLSITLIAIIFCLIGLSQIPEMEGKLRASAFQVVSILTTTGYATADYSQWSPLSQAVIFLLMFLGGCAGSTAGNVKIGRYLIMAQRAKIELKQMVHPRAMVPLRYGGRIIEDGVVINVLQFFFLWIILIFLGTITMAALGLDPFSSITATVTCLGNIGPGFGLVGPTENFGFIPSIGKYVLCLLMLLGRLELYPMLILLIPDYWKE